jgi:hypothetical protein
MTNALHQTCGRYERPASRRQFLARAGGGMGMLALAGLLKEDRLLAEGPANPLAPKAAHFPAKAKSVIWLFMEGGPSAVDVFDPKPELDKNNGKKIDINVFFGNPGPLMKSPFKFAQYGECGAWVCEKYTNVAKHVDDIAFIKSCFSESDNHVPALYQINTGIPRPGFPAAPMPIISQGRSRGRPGLAAVRWGKRPIRSGTRWLILCRKRMRTGFSFMRISMFIRCGITVHRRRQMSLPSHFITCYSRRTGRRMAS